MNAISDSQTLYSVIEEAARRSPQAVAYRIDGVSVTYAELLARSRQVAAMLEERFSVRPGAGVVHIAGNSERWLVVSLAIQALGAVEFPAEPELTGAELKTFLLHSECRVCFVGTTDLAETIIGLGIPWLDELAVIVTEDADCRAAIAGADSVPGPPQHPACFCLSELLHQASRQEFDASARQHSLRTTDLAVVIRSSGTTGPPKLVMLSHANFLHTLKHVPERVGVRSDDRFLCCLPLWHLYGRLVAWIALSCGARLDFVALEKLDEGFQHVRPMFFPGFPVIWMNIYHRLMEQLESRPSLDRWFRLCLAISRAYYHHLYRARGHDICLIPRTLGQSLRIRSLSTVVAGLLLLPQKIINAVLFSAVRRQLGGRLRAAIIGDAPLPPHIDLALRALGFRVLEGYGSSEQMITATRGLRDNVVGSVGQVLREIDLLILDDAGHPVADGVIGELTVSGPQVFLGYFGEPQKTRAVLHHRDGKIYYRTGDLGRRDCHGNLLVVGRKVHRRILADGSRFYPEQTEALLSGTRFIDHVMVFPAADGELLALLVPDFGKVCRYFYRHQPEPSPYTENSSRTSGGVWWEALPKEEAELDRVIVGAREELEEILQSEVIVALFRTELKRFLSAAGLPAHQLPTCFVLSRVPFLRGRELTPTLKLRRDIILARLEKKLPRYPLEL